MTPPWLHAQARNGKAREAGEVREHGRQYRNEGETQQHRHHHRGGGHTEPRVIPRPNTYRRTHTFRKHWQQFGEEEPQPPCFFPAAFRSTLADSWPRRHY